MAISNEWNRDLPAIEKQKAAQAEDRINAYVTRILEEAEQREKERLEYLKEVYAERDRKIAAIRAARENREV